MRWMDRMRMWYMGDKDEGRESGKALYSIEMIPHIGTYEQAVTCYDDGDAGSGDETFLGTAIWRARFLMCVQMPSHVHSLESRPHSRIANL